MTFSSSLPHQSPTCFTFLGSTEANGLQIGGVLIGDYVNDSSTVPAGSSYNLPTPTKVGSIPVNAQLELQSTTGALLLMRMTTTQRNAMQTVVNGMMIFNSTTDTFQFYYGSTWVSLSAGSGGVTGPGSSTNTAVALWNGTGGSVLENSLVLIDSSGNVTGVDALTASGTITTSAGNVVATTGNVVAGSSGHAGTVTSYPSTATEGSLILAAVSNATGNFTTSISNAAAVAQNQVVTIPDGGAATSNFLLNSGVQSMASGSDLKLDKGTGTVSAGAVTISHQAGVITTTSLATAAGSSATVTLTNTLIATTSVVLVSLMGGTNTTIGVELSATAGSGSSTITISNNNASAENSNNTCSYTNVATHHEDAGYDDPQDNQSRQRSLDRRHCALNRRSNAIREWLLNERVPVRKCDRDHFNFFRTSPLDQEHLRHLES